MARIRSIKPEFPQSESIGKLSRDARPLFVLLWTIAARSNGDVSDLSYIQFARLKTAPMGKLFGAPTAAKFVRTRRFRSTKSSGDW